MRLPQAAYTSVPAGAGDGSRRKLPLDASDMWTLILRHFLEGRFRTAGGTSTA
jgi:hypothetical protein